MWITLEFGASPPNLTCFALQESIHLFLLVGVQEEAVPDAAQPLRGEHPPPLAARSLGAAQEQHHVLQEDHRVIERKEEAIGEKDRQDLKRDQQIHT